MGNGVEVCAGMVIGQTAKAEDMEVNPCKEKKLSNMRSKGDGSIRGYCGAAGDDAGNVAGILG